MKRGIWKRRISQRTRIFVPICKNLNQRWKVQNKQTTRIVLHSRVGCANEKFSILFHRVAIYLFPRIDAASCTSPIRVYCEQESARNTLSDPGIQAAQEHDFMGNKLKWKGVSSLKFPARLLTQKTYNEYTVDFWLCRQVCWYDYSGAQVTRRQCKPCCQTFATWHASSSRPRCSK